MDVPEEVAVERSRLLFEGNRLRSLRERWGRLGDIHHRYAELLPDVTVARCPHTGEVVRWPIDTFGLDGWFWEYQCPMRRLPTPRPPNTWLAMTGALRLAEPLEYTDFIVRPGPGAPFVVPRILKRPGVRAVISEVPVGGHTGWTISYFGPRPDVTLVDFWGTNYYLIFADGKVVGDESGIATHDFTLTGWLRSGALLWIEPGDESATLREGVDGCPFVDLPRSREIHQVVFKGKLLT